MALVNLYPHQQEAVEKLKTGSILNGGVGSGKSITALAYFYQVVCNCMERPRDLYIITTAKKRDTQDWQREAAKFNLSTDRDCSIERTRVMVDSWNNVHKYANIENQFFIFDEQKVVGYGAWVQSFIKIAKKNDWILLSATPGDTWMDYLPVFIANGFFKNKTHFIREHVVPCRGLRYFKVDRYINTRKLERLRSEITVNMPFRKKTIRNPVVVKCAYNEDLTKKAMRFRWNVFTEEPMQDINECCQVVRKITNTDSSRLLALIDILEEHDKLIIFYNYDYELEQLREFAKDYKIPAYGWNGHKHEATPFDERWLYLVQYNAGAEAWECITTNVTVFFSLNYSYKIMEQASGRIDRVTTPFVNLYYYILLSDSPIDKAIVKALKNKKTFNEKGFIRFP